jgi:hypothetical protein
MVAEIIGCNEMDHRRNWEKEYTNARRTDARATGEHCAGLRAD